MTWISRLKLALGFVIVLTLVAGGTLLFTQRQSRALSTTATIRAESYPVGTDYGGMVVRQLVEVGDEVSAGDPLFEVRSLQLRRDIVSGYVDASSLPGGVDDEGTSTILATVDGTISSVAVPQGGFAQSGGVLATIDRDGSLFVEADFVLSARDYARIAAGAEAVLLLPDDSTLTGSIEHIDVATADGEALSTVRIESAALADAPATGLSQPGTPVSVTIALRDDGPLAGVTDAVYDLMRKVGL